MSAATPTPRAVLDIVLDSPNGRAIAAMYDAEFTARTLPSLVTEVIAALAASAGPLSAEELAELREWFAACQDFRAGQYAFKLLTAYTALAAECIALRATTNDILNHFTRYGHPGQDSVETGWIPVETVKRWRELARTPMPEGQG